ncbi:MAG: hypothetical protein J1E37_01810 [Prevotella sp.]|nr:hypothetical protein [Prevotella sp.]
MKKLLLFLLLVLVLASCGGKRKDVAYYEAKIDSIRKAETVRDFKQQAGVYDDPVEQFFDTLQLRPLPIRSVGANIGSLGHFVSAPPSVVSLLGYPVETPLRMTLLPRSHGHRVVMLAEGPDSIPPIISLLTLNADCQPIDDLLIYEMKLAERGDDFGMSYSDYFITSKFEVTIVNSFLPNNAKFPYVESTRRYTISKEGYFEEQIVDL